MSKELNDIDQMTRILLGEASTEEREIYLHYLADNPDEKLIFDSFQKEWQTTNDVLLHKGIDLDAAWNRQKSAILEKPESTLSSNKIQIWKWAAVLALGIGLAFYVITNQRTVQIDQVATVSTGVGETFELALSDGSVITLNENTALEYMITEQKREVKLVGEAFFKIARDEAHPFIVNTNQSYVKVLGTSFNINTTSSSTRVFVKEGLVEFGLTDNSGKKELLGTGKLGQLKNKELTSIDNGEANIISWYSQELVFEKSPLVEVLSDLAKTYHVSFNYNLGLLSDCHLTATFTKDQLPDILSTLSTIYHLNFEADKSTYQVTGKGCK